MAWGRGKKHMQCTDEQSASSGMHWGIQHRTPQRTLCFEREDTTVEEAVDVMAPSRRLYEPPLELGYTQSVTRKLSREEIFCPLSVRSTGAFRAHAGPNRNHRVAKSPFHAPGFSAEPS